MDPVPLPTYYSFSFVGGLLCDVSGLNLWQAHNPRYDPGPPPPPKKPKNPNKDNQERPDLAPVNSKAGSDLTLESHTAQVVS